MTNGFGVIIEMLVAILLALTIAYCISLNRRLKLLKADEQSLRATISELVTATEIAERAIAGLKLTVQECETGLGARLRSADRFTADLDRSIAAGKDMLRSAGADRRRRRRNSSASAASAGGSADAAAGAGTAARRASGRRRRAGFRRAAARQGPRSGGMIRYFRELRLIPIAMVASACLLALVAADLLLGRNSAANSGSGATSIADATVIHAGPGTARPADQKRSWAQQMFNFPDPKGEPPEPDRSGVPSGHRTARRQEQCRHYYWLGNRAERR